MISEEGRVGNENKYIRSRVVTPEQCHLPHDKQSMIGEVWRSSSTYYRTMEQKMTRSTSHTIGSLLASM
jgi:hypothetical protein